MKPLIIGSDYSQIKTVAQLKDSITEDYETTRKLLNKFDFLIAYQDTGSWGCDSSSFFLMRERSTGKFFENHGGHCSCYGFEGQWQPEETVLARFLERDWYFPAGGYDSDSDKHREQVIDYIKRLAASQQAPAKEPE